MVRLQATRHSAFVMCVAGSQKLMQSSKVLPPPPGALGADWLGLPEDAPGDRAMLLAPVPVEPPVENCVGSCGEFGAIAGALGKVAGSVDDGPVEGLGVAGAAGGPVVMTPLGEVLPERPGLADGVPDRACAIACPPRGAATSPVTCELPPPDRAAATSTENGHNSTAAAAIGQMRRSTSIGNRPFPAGPRK
jgi:hypothetical protein